MKIDPVNAGRDVRLWTVGVTLTLAGLALMIAASAVVIGYFGPFLGRGVPFVLTVIGIALAVGLGLVWRWLAQR